MKIGIAQICSLLEPSHNLNLIDSLIKNAKKHGIQAVFLPECFYSMSDGLKPTTYLVEKGNDHYQNIQNLAKNHKIYLLGGTAATLEDNAIYNRTYNFGPDGEELGIYDKIHLFSCELTSKGDKNSIDESQIYTEGTKPSIVNAGPLKIGLSVCFDIRFPEMYRNYALSGANMLSISAAFTVPSGKAHWHILVRARAIENQCFVVAPAQWGKNNDRIRTFGHSLIVDPWGDILVDAGEGEKLVVADIDLKKIDSVRKSIKIF